MVTKKKQINPAHKDIIKKYGNVIMKGNELIKRREDYKTLTISPAVDLALNGGVREGTWIMLSGEPKSGKAQPLSSIVYTPKGKVFMGDIEMGQEVCTPDGGVANVTGIYPQGIKDVYKVTMSDGSVTHCESEHLWKVKKKRSKEYEVISTGELKNDLYYSDRLKWSVAPVDYVEFDMRENILDPELLGYIISFYSPKYNNLRASTPERLEYVNMLLSECGFKKIDENGTIKDKDLLAIIQKFLTSKSKAGFYIHPSYLYNTLDDRIALLKGLLSLKAFFNKNFLDYYHNSKEVIDMVVDIARSIGLKTTRCNDNRVNIKFEAYNDRSDLIMNKTTERKRVSDRQIADIEFVGPDRCQCISIDHPDHLYITDDFIPTHNTTTAMQLAKNAQDEGRRIIYLNTEGRLNELNFEVEGLDASNMEIITSEEKPLSAEEFLDILYRLLSLPEYEGCLCIIDSISSLAAQKDLDNEITGTSRLGLPRILANFTKKCGQIVPNNKIIMCLITHIISNTSGFGAPRQIDGGVKIQFQADTRMEVKKVSPWIVDDSRIGQSIDWKIYYSCNGAKSYECQSWLRYGKGIDSCQELLIIAQELGMISKAGAWFTIDYLEHNKKLASKVCGLEVVDDEFTDKEYIKKMKFQGGNRLYDFLKENPELYNAMFADIKEMIA